MDFSDAEPDGPYPELARLIKGIIRQSQPRGGTLSTRPVCRKLGLSHETIVNMVSGYRPSRSLLIEFGEGMRVSVNDLLKAADYPLVRERTSSQASSEN